MDANKVMERLEKIEERANKGLAALAKIRRAEGDAICSPEMASAITQLSGIKSAAWAAKQEVLKDL